MTSVRRIAGVVTLALVLRGGELKAQASAGSWDIAFNHQYQTARTKPAYGVEVLPPNCPQFPFGENPLPQDPFSSGPNPSLKQFQGVHITLIPLPPYRGQVLMWEGDAGYRPGRFIPGFTRYSILDPTQDPTAPTGPIMFRNYYMDLGGVGGTPHGTLFCTNGSWNENGGASGFRVGS